MIQKILALLVVVFFITRLIKQKRDKKISNNEFFIWLLFWIFVGFAVIFIKLIDNLVFSLGFSSSGIDALLYLGIAVSFYLILRMRIRIEKMERDITKVVREITLIKNK